MSDILVIKCNFKISPKELEKKRLEFLKQKNEGIVTIPIGFDAVVVPEDVIVKFENHLEGV